MNEAPIKSFRNPVVPAKRSDGALEEIATLRLRDGSRAHSFRTLLDHLSEIVKNTRRYIDAGPDSPTFNMVATPNTTQLQDLELLRAIEM